MPKSFRAYEFEKDAMAMTGAVEHYTAETIDEAVQKLLYTKKLRDGDAFIGPSGRSVYTGNRAWSVVEERPHAYA
jgi:hypothetical protein